MAGATVFADGLPGTMNFRNVTASRINQTTGETTNNEKHVEIGDFDEDGDLDVVIAVAYSDFGARRNKLYENNGGTFDEITTSGAIPGFSVNKVSRVAFLRDFDMDGHLDLWIINDQNSNNDQVFIAQWNAGSFTQFNEDNSRIPAGANTGAACSGWSADFNQDGFPDVYCGNYPNSPQDRMYFNNGSGIFNDVTSTNVPARNDYVVNVNGADMNGDGKLDVLISNNNSNHNYIYYNDNLNAGSGVGDFSYSLTLAQQSLGNPAANENTMVAADLDGDGDQDIYWSNGLGATVDVINRNNGNDGDNQAMLSGVGVLPDSVIFEISRKVTFADFNQDGQIDIFVGKENVRPTVLRNVTVDGNIQFVDWTPSPAFPTGNVHKGWQASLFDTDGDTDPDIFLGGWTDDHLFENVASTEYTENDIAGNGGVVPAVNNKNPAAIVGTSGPGNPDVYEHQSLSADSFLSIVVNGADDYLVEVLDIDDNVLATIDRGGLGVEEATQYDPASMPSVIKVRITAQACAQNVSGDCGYGIDDFLDLLGAWGPNPGHPADLDGDDEVGINDFLDLLANWGTSDYIAEFLARTG
jgi:hypothetical protein